MPAPQRYSRMVSVVREDRTQCVEPSGYRLTRNVAISYGGTVLNGLFNRGVAGPSRIIACCRHIHCGECPS